ncbi:hypothetical protein RQP54_17145 [Curvibacter sp. APW13]|uniref:hypothetical protein n=1 Tax=Curvibacter sp. APW13 TaxID=3077236 RepID=UPI0028DE1807|nr:hypothetical protein [Curvibacter sp. APW13]MDT8992601.1 hypothetical protein [Curvibacter sp. APW13]
MEVKQGMVLELSQTNSTSIYFPESARLSLQVEALNSPTTELAVVGKSGAAGLQLLFDCEPSVEDYEKSTVSKVIPHCVVVQSGAVWRAQGSALQSLALAEIRVFQALMMCNEFMTDFIALTALCNTHHSALQRLSREILLRQDEAEISSPSIPMRTMKNVHRISNTELKECAAHLVDVNAIALRGGLIYPLDRPALIRESCSCYDVIRGNDSKLFSSLLKI